MVLRTKVLTIIWGDNMKKKYKIISKTRFFLFIITVSAITTMFVVSLLSINEVHGSNHGYGYEYSERKVMTGDTLWMIALDHMPDGYDVRKMIYEIKMINKMDKSNLYPGDIIKIPIIK